MSHIVKVKANIKDLDALERAAKSLGLELVRNKTSFRYYASNQGTCDHVLRVPHSDPDAQAYEIGLTRNGDHFEILWDSYDSRIVSKVADPNNRHNRANLDRLNQAYALQVTLAHYQRKGYRVSQSKDASGNVVLRASR